MKNLTKFLVLIIGFSAFTTVAQNADSVIVIYDNQKTIVPLPALGSQTSVSYSDSTKVVEFGVWVRKPGETSPFSQMYSDEVNSKKSKKNSKWFSEIEVGYIQGSNQGGGIYGTTYYSNEIPYTMTEYYTLSTRKGYQIRLSVLESEFYLNKKSSISSGFKLGFSQSNLQAHSYGNVTDSTGNVISSFDEYYKFRINSFQFLYQFGYCYHFNTGKLPARITLGNSLGILRTSISTNNPQTYNSFLYSGGFLYASLLQPYLGMEIWKMGLLFSADFSYPFNHYSIMHSPLGGNICVALTYRIF